MKIIAALFIALILAGCAHKPPASQPQVNRTAKADKYAAPKKATPVEMPTPNQTVKKRWFSGWKIRLLHK
jgi:PBP1b-binding outer membrane lipoprotein LpoB